MTGHKKYIQFSGKMVQSPKRSIHVAGFFIVTFWLLYQVAVVFGVFCYFFILYFSSGEQLMEGHNKMFKLFFLT